MVIQPTCEQHNVNWSGNWSRFYIKIFLIRINSLIWFTCTMNEEWNKKEETGGPKAGASSKRNICRYIKLSSYVHKCLPISFMPKLMPLSHLLMEHFDIPVGNKLDVRAASHTRTRKSVRRVYPCITSGSRFRWKQVDQEEGSIISRAQHVLAEARQWLSQRGRTPGHISGCCISTQFKWRILTAQVETACIAERGMERGKLPHGCTLGHSLEVPLAGYDACNFNLGF